MAFGKPVLIWSRHARSAALIRTVLEALAGPHNCSHISIQDNQKPLFRRFLDGKLVNFTHDNGGQVYDEMLHIACGGERIVAQRINGKSYDFRPNAVWVIACDVLPNRRLDSFVVIQPTRDLTPKEAKARTARVMNEIRGVLNWSIEGQTP